MYTVLCECCKVNIPSKHAGSDPEAFWLRPVMAVTASLQLESGRRVYAGSDFPHPFQFRCSAEGMDHTAQNRPGTDLDGLVRVWSGSKPVCRNHRSRFLAGRNCPATSFPLSDSVPFFHRHPRFQGFKVLLSFWPLGARKRSYIRTRHSL